MVSEYPMKWNTDAYGLFRRVGEAINELTNHPEALQRAHDLEEMTLSLFITRAYKFGLCGLDHYSDIDKIVLDDFKASVLSSLGVNASNTANIPQAPSITEERRAESPKGKEPKAELINEAPSAIPHGNDAVEDDPYKGYILIRIVKEFPDPKPFQAEVSDPNNPKKTRTYYIRNGDMFHAPISLAKFLMDRHMAVSVNVETKVV